MSDKANNDGIEVIELPIDKHPHFKHKRAEWDGKSMADFWDKEAKAFVCDAPSCLRGIKKFVKAIIE